MRAKSFKFIKDLKDKSYRISSLIWNDRKVFL
jgi:hypothetical protein